jgi:hypothetical protein
LEITIAFGELIVCQYKFLWRFEDDGHRRLEETAQ